MIERIRAALSYHLGRSVQVLTRQEWDNANSPDGQPTLLAHPLSPFRGVEDSNMFMSAVVSAQPYAETPGSHVVRYDAADYPDVINIDSHDWILDLPSDAAWSRVIAISGLADTPQLRSLAREHVFGVHTFRDDHRSPTVPPDIGGATPKDD
jgi:hypothetical protein